MSTTKIPADNEGAQPLGLGCTAGVRPLLWARKDQVQQAMRMPHMVVCCTEQETRGRSDFQPLYDQAGMDAKDAEIERLRAELAGMLTLLEVLRTKGESRYCYVESRAGQMVHVAEVIDSARALLGPNVAHQPGAGGDSAAWAG